MRVLILGGGGMLGRKLVDYLIESANLNGKKIEAITSADAFANSNGALSEKIEINHVVADITDMQSCRQLVKSKPDLVYHLASVVSGEAEANFEKGYQVNLDGTRNLFEAIREIADGYRPRVVYTSSAAVFGPPYPEVIEDDFILQPTTSYGTQKVIGELLLNDYSRKGFLDGVGLRLPTICVRPGKPNAAASGVFSNIIREPLSGQSAVLSVSRDTRMIFTSPKSAIGFLAHAAAIDTSALGNRRCLTMPGVNATIADEIDSLRRIAGDDVAALIKEEFDPAAQRIVDNWNFPPVAATRAKALGFTCESNFDELIKSHIDNELGGKILGGSK
jgi:nucleoside-diphosphate-sugar epimerase